ncbi:MAG: guided entry of tail-anchored proteins factor 1 [Candidatus Diapherotrites archaeon]|nr:guided entry of tail-anchored proteins factor 1 [Candidatus Diapherotrites archaeon]
MGSGTRFLKRPPASGSMEAELRSKLPPKLRNRAYPPELMLEILKYRAEPISSHVISQKIGGRLTAKQVERILRLGGGRPPEVLDGLKRGIGSKERSRKTKVGLALSWRDVFFGQALTRYGTQPLDKLLKTRRQLMSKLNSLKAKLNKEMQIDNYEKTTGLRRKITKMQIELKAINEAIRREEALKEWGLKADPKEIEGEIKYRQELLRGLYEQKEINRRIGKKASNAMEKEIRRLSIEIAILMEVAKKRGL